MAVAIKPSVYSSIWDFTKPNLLSVGISSLVFLGNVVISNLSTSISEASTTEPEVNVFEYLFSACFCGFQSRFWNLVK